MNYLITYETTGQAGYPKSIIIHDVPQWVNDNPKCYIIVCQALFNTTVKKSDLNAVLNNINKR